MSEPSGRATVLVNPSAGAGTAGTTEARVIAILRRLGFDATAVHPAGPEQATELAATAAANDLLLPLGGDGMISCVAAGCVESGALLTPLPAGRGNDFVRSLGLPRDTLAVTRMLASGRGRAVDVGTVGDRVFLGTLSVGFDALSNARANRLRRMRGAAVYTAAGVATALTARPSSFVLRSSGPDGERVESCDGWNLSIGNSGRHGGGLTATPGADLTDGLLDVVLTCGRRFDQLAASALLERGGRHVRLPYVRAWRATRVELTATDRRGEPLEIYADGDPIGMAPETIGIRPGALRLFY